MDPQQIPDPKKAEQKIEEKKEEKKEEAKEEMKEERKKVEETKEKPKKEEKKEAPSPLTKSENTQSENLSSKSEKKDDSKSEKKSALEDAAAALQALDLSATTVDAPVDIWFIKVSNMKFLMSVVGWCVFVIIFHISLGIARNSVVPGPFIAMSIVLVFPILLYKYWQQHPFIAAAFGAVFALKTVADVGFIIFEILTIFDLLEIWILLTNLLNILLLLVDFGVCFVGTVVGIRLFRASGYI